MSDTTGTPESPRTVSVFTCMNRRHASRSCFALIDDTPEVRQAHRQWHIDQETDREALRGAVKSRDETIARLREEISGYRRDVTAYGQEVAAFHGEVQRVETPVIPPQLEINRDGYTDDELDDEPDEPTPIPLAFDDAEDLAEAPDVVGARTAADDLDDDDADDPHTVTLQRWHR